MSLRLDWCDHDAVRYACTRWHYSKSVPAGKLVKIGVWENGTFRGVIVFSRGATPAIGRPYGLSQIEVCELTRVALRSHRAPVSRMISIAVRMLRRQSPNLRLIVSYAATEKDHIGAIYQAGNWVYVGARPCHVFVVKGKTVHPKTLHSKYGYGAQSMGWIRANLDSNATKRDDMKRLKYLMPLDDEMRKQIEPLRQPYPKRVKQAMAPSREAQRRRDTDPHAPEVLHG